MLETTYRTPFLCWSVIFILLPTDFLALQVIKFYCNQSVHWRIQLALFLSLITMGWKREETIIIASGSQNGFKYEAQCLNILFMFAWGKHSNLHELKYHARPLILYMIFLSTNQHELQLRSLSLSIAACQFSFTVWSQFAEEFPQRGRCVLMKIFCSSSMII